MRPKKSADVLRTGLRYHRPAKPMPEHNLHRRTFARTNKPLRRAPQAGKRRDGLVTTQQRWSVLILLPEEFRFALNLCRGGRACLFFLFHSAFGFFFSWSRC